MNLTNAIDAHFHIGPEPIPRRFTADELAEREEGQIATVVLKNHFYPTTSFIQQADIGENLGLIGSVTLNNSVGGLNPEAVRGAAALTEDPIVVWFPTINAENYLEKSDWEIRPEWVTDDSFVSRRSDDVEPVVTLEHGQLTEASEAVLEAVKETGSILATGHISWKAARVLTERAKDLGIETVILTHPIYQLIDMPVEVQQELTAYDGVYAEQLYAMNTIDDIPMERIAEQIREVGPENIVMGTDMGQQGNPSSSEAMEKFCALLKAEGFDEEALQQMSEKNPSQLLGKDITRCDK
ncbi:MAG: DUF6282 family protein [Candidatus Nanohaloarchaea archaeon]|nr:DUF6282 family protein [Candidatus Nanohaloarchaea archaeon]